MSLGSIHFYEKK